jgi:hypothetical protein
VDRDGERSQRPHPHPYPAPQGDRHVRESPTLLPALTPASSRGVCLSRSPSRSPEYPPSPRRPGSHRVADGRLESQARDASPPPRRPPSQTSTHVTPGRRLAGSDRREEDHRSAAHDGVFSPAYRDDDALSPSLLCATEFNLDACRSVKFLSTLIGDLGHGNRRRRGTQRKTVKCVTVEKAWAI